MVTSEKIESFIEGLDSLSSNFKLVYSSLRKMKREQVDKTLIQKGREYLMNESVRLEKLKTVYDDFSGQIAELCDNYLTQVNFIEKEDQNEVKGLKSDFKNMIEEVKKRNEELEKRTSLYHEREPTFVYRDDSVSKMDVNLVMKYPGSYVSREYMSDKRTEDGNVFIDSSGENDEWIVKYMKEDEGLVEDIKKMKKEEKEKLIDDLDFFKLPIKKDIIGELGRNEDNEMMEAWRNNVCISINGHRNSELIDLLKENHLMDSLLANKYLRYIQYQEEKREFDIKIQLKYEGIIKDYLKNGKTISTELMKKCLYDGNDNELINEMNMIGINLSKEEEREIKGCFEPRFLKDSTILTDAQYDTYLREWAGDYKWKLVYRASEHGYTANSFHDYCDSKRPTLIVIKSSEGWIFGGYTTRSWNGECIYYDMTCNNNRHT